MRGTMSFAVRSTGEPTKGAALVLRSGSELKLQPILKPGPAAFARYPTAPWPAWSLSAALVLSEIAAGLCARAGSLAGSRREGTILQELEHGVGLRVGVACHDGKLARERSHVLPHRAVRIGRRQGRRLRGFAGVRRMRRVGPVEGSLAKTFRAPNIFVTRR